MTASHTALIYSIEAARHLRRRLAVLEANDATGALIDLELGHSLERARNPEVRQIGARLVRNAQTQMGLR
jgi:hypothetical protein